MTKKPKVYIKTIRTATRFCPTCLEMLDGLSCMSKVRGDYDPYPGALTVCLYCASMLKFDKDLVLRNVPDSERDKVLAKDPLARVAYESAQKWVASQRRKNN